MNVPRNKIWRQPSTSHWRYQSGNLTVEMAFLILPFFLLLTGIMEFGWYFFHQHTLQFATREGMRLALVGETLMDDQGNPLSREESIIQTIKEKASLAMDPNAVQVWIFKVGSNYEDPTGWETLAPNAGNPADYMRIKTSYEHEFLIPLIGQLFSNDGHITLWAEGTYRNELFQEV
ncbi:MAG: pilus assembly protein [Nitrospirae bacterium]|nr:MAG: pilus assembly protein [Nitrospirota bacterium]